MNGERGLRCWLLLRLRLRLRLRLLVALEVFVLQVDEQLLFSALISGQHLIGIEARIPQLLGVMTRVERDESLPIERIQRCRI